MAPTTHRLIVSFSRSALAIIVGYIVLVLASTFVQETLFGGISYLHSPRSNLVLAGLLTPLSAVLAGVVTAAIAGRKFLWHVAPLCVWTVIETTLLYRTHRVDGPLWFEGGAGLALIVGAIAGAWLWSIFHQRRVALA